MAPSRRESESAALNAMKAIGIPFHKTKPVLKNLLQVHGGNWKHIEAERYSLLANAIFEIPDPTPCEPQEKRCSKRRKYDGSGDEESVGSKKTKFATSDDIKLSLKELKSRLKNRHSSASASSPQTPSITSGKGKKAEKVTLRKQERVVQDSPSRNLRGRMTKSPSPATPTARPKAKDISPGMELRSKRRESPSYQASLAREMAEERSHQVPPICELIEKVSGKPIPKGLVFMRSTSPTIEDADRSTFFTSERGKKPIKHGRTGNLTCDDDELEVEHRIEAPIAPALPLYEAHGEEVIDLEMPITPALPTDEVHGCELAEFEVPIAVIHPPYPIPTEKQDPYYQPPEVGASSRNDFAGQRNETCITHVVSKVGNETVTDPNSRNRTTCNLVEGQNESSTIVEVASSDMGKVKLSLSCSFDALGHPDFQMPSMESVYKEVEARCLRTYKILEPTFSIKNLLKEICQCALEMGSEPEAKKQENNINIIPAFESLKNSGTQNVLGGISVHASNGLENIDASQLAGITAQNDLHLTQKVPVCSENGRSKKKKDCSNPEPSTVNSHGSVMFQQSKLAVGDTKPLHDTNDITKREERIRISVVNEFSSDACPPSFLYIPQNTVYQNAIVTFSLARIGDQNCCGDCFGDCLAASTPCACAQETGGSYAYSSEGLVKEELLDTCISLKRSPREHSFSYCIECPLERARNEITPESCKGHLRRIFIKECWSKCGCSRLCGNRVVQRGLTCNLQVFHTGGSKGWGLRTLDELPKGTFVCEYVGEILTSKELLDRTILCSGTRARTCPVLLDANWGSERILKDEEALCLDSSFYGNIARFINHRCFDANLIEIPVEVETPDRHYYHLALFTTRKIEAFEELNWDYGTDFDDQSHPVKAFRCHCKSKFCRDKNHAEMKRGLPAVR